MYYGHTMTDSIRDLYRDGLEQLGPRRVGVKAIKTEIMRETRILELMERTNMAVMTNGLYLRMKA